jgi:hypothetical protein
MQTLTPWVNVFGDNCNNIQIKLFSSLQLMPPSRKTRRALVPTPPHVQKQQYVDSALHKLQLQPPGSKNISKAAKPYKGKFSRQTLWRQHTGCTKSAVEEGIQCQLLSPFVEQVVVAWLKNMAAEGNPATITSLQMLAKRLTGHMPLLRWVANFQKQHPDVKFTSARWLDSKRAWAFNKTIVTKHFNEVWHAMTGVKVGNMYNFDEQGVQLGGGKKTTGELHAFDSNDGLRTTLQDKNMELVTIMDVVCADGSKLVPGFIFQGSDTFEMQWFEKVAKEIL